MSNIPPSPGFDDSGWPPAVIPAYVPTAASERFREPTTGFVYRVTRFAYYPGHPVTETYRRLLGLERDSPLHGLYLLDLDDGAQADYLFDLVLLPALPADFHLDGVPLFILRARAYVRHSRVFAELARQLDPAGPDGGVDRIVHPSLGRESERKAALKALRVILNIAGGAGRPTRAKRPNPNLTIERVAAAYWELEPSYWPKDVPPEPVAAALGVARNTLQRHIDAGIIPWPPPKSPDSE